MSAIFSLLILAFAGFSNGFTGQGLMYPGRTDLFELSILHINDFHARFEEVAPNAGTCHRDRGQQCVGGLSRVFTATKQLLEERPNAIFLNAGDHYQGTLWYNIHGWNATVEFMNKLPHDAMTIGNHEFDDKISGLVPFLKGVNAPVLVTNIDTRNEPSMQGLLKNSTILKRGGKKIGVIGVILRSTPEIAATEKLIFLDEVETVNLEAEKLKREDDVDIVIVLSHCGIEIDRIMGAKCPLVDVIVGGHSHTFLYSGPPPFVDHPADEYPIVVNQEGTNRKVLIVQAAAFTKYLGNLTVWFDENGEVEDWEGNPILLDSNYNQDPEMLEALAPWKIEVDAIGKKVIGRTKVGLKNDCGRRECNIGNLITDSMVEAYIDKVENDTYWTYAAIATMNGGGVRSSIEPEKGIITYGDIIAAQPFENTWDVIELQGKDIRQTLEISVSEQYRRTNWPGKAFLIWSGLRVSFDMRKEAHSRVLDVKVRCRKCRIPKYEDLNDEEWYRIVMPNALVNGMDGHTVIAENHKNHEIGKKDIDLLIPYIQKMSPLINGVEGRIIFENDQQ